MGSGRQGVLGIASGPGAQAGGGTAGTECHPGLGHEGHVHWTLFWPRWSSSCCLLPCHPTQPQPCLPPDSHPPSSSGSPSVPGTRSCATSSSQEHLPRTPLSVWHHLSPPHPTLAQPHHSSQLHMGTESELPALEPGPHTGPAWPGRCLPEVEKQLPLPLDKPFTCCTHCSMCTHGEMAKGWGASHLSLGSVP